MLSSLLPIVLLFISAYAADPYLNERDFFHFVTRPDLTPPRWDIVVYNDSYLAPGYWFVAPKQTTERTVGTKASWTGPAIYDKSGELIWSGTSQLDSPNVMDFRLNSIGPDGQTMMTMLDRDRRSGLLMSNDYGIKGVIDIIGNEEGIGLNGHEFKVVNGGNSVLIIRNHERDATQREKHAVGFEGEVCLSKYMKLVELDISTGQELFTFDPRGHIGIDESTLKGNNDVNYLCSTGWDFMHANSADKCDDGHYLYNARHTDTIYKISKDDGTVLWRLGGNHSDFSMNGIVFSRQHDIRCRSQNKTHTVISILDNAKGEDHAAPTYTHSRGLVIALNTINMSASLTASYDHPDKEFAFRRGNLQLLENGNVLMGWSERAQWSEHAADGTPLITARFKADWFGSYRNYKFEYTGGPSTRPDVHAAVYLDWVTNNTTRVHVSWNGDTEVRSWNLYDIAPDGKSSFLISANRTGFETRLEWAQYLDAIVVEGVDEAGEPISESHVVKTIEHPSDPCSSRSRVQLAEVNITGARGHHTQIHQDL